MLTEQEVPVLVTRETFLISNKLGYFGDYKQ